MKIRMIEKGKGRSSLATRGRFFLLLISVISWCEPLYATVPEDLENGKIVKADSLRIRNNEVVKIYITDGAQLTNLDNTITTPLVLINVNHKKEFSKKKQEKSHNNTKNNKSVKRSVQKQSSVPQFYFANPRDKEFNHFDVGLDKAVVITTYQLKSFSINKLFIYSFMLLVSTYLVYFFRENTFFISLTGKNFQRPPP